MVAGIYLIRNKVTSKTYVGSSIDIFRRWKAHILGLEKGCHRNQKLQRSWDKCGSKSFEFSIADLVTDGRPLEPIEQAWINSMQSVEHGYNLMPIVGNIGRMPKSDEHRAKIGAAQVGRKRSQEAIEKMTLAARSRAPRKQLPETVEKIVAANTGKKRSDEFRARMSEIAKARAPRPMSEESRRKISNARRGKPLSEHHRQRIKEGKAAAKALASQ